MTPDDLYATTTLVSPGLVALTFLPVVIVAVTLVAVVLAPAPALRKRKKARTWLLVGGATAAALLLVVAFNAVSSARENATKTAIEHYQDTYGLSLTPSQIHKIANEPGTTTTLLVETSHGAHRSYAFELIDTQVVPLMQVGDVWEPVPYAMDSDASAGDTESVQESSND